eukprot:gene8546-8729_t
MLAGNDFLQFFDFCKQQMLFRLVTVKHDMPAGVWYSVMGVDMDTRLPALYHDDHWRQVVAQLGLSKEQVTQVLACAELYFTSLTRLLHERDVLQQQLAAATALGAAERRRHCGSISGCDGFSQQLAVLDRLQANLRQEYSLRIMLSGFVWVRTMSCLQFAKTAVYSHPFFPDIHAMVAVMYNDARRLAPSGQHALVFPHRAAPATAALADWCWPKQEAPG